MEYNVYIQDKFYSILEGKNTSDILRQIAIDIANNRVNIDSSVPQNIRIECIHE